MTTIKLRGGTAAEWATANPVLVDREVGVEQDTRRAKVGDGVTPWTTLPYLDNVLSADRLVDGTTAKAFLATERTKLAGVADGATANAPDATLLARANHTGTQSADSLVDGTTIKAFLATERTKLAGVATAATANAPDATLLARANHTGSQAESTITGLVTDLAGKLGTTDASVTNARTPTAHAATHGTAGTDAVALAAAQITAGALAPARLATGAPAAGMYPDGTGAWTVLPGGGNAQPLDADLTTIAGLTATTDSVMQAKAGAWAARTIAQLKADLGATVDVQVFTVDGTWTKPAGTPLLTRVACIGGGCGGGSGRRGASGTAWSGGAGGSSGTVATADIPTSSLTATVAVTVAAQVAGGLGRGADSSNGLAGAFGGPSSFGSYLQSGIYNAFSAPPGGSGATANGGIGTGTAFGSQSNSGGNGTLGAAGGGGGAGGMHAGGTGGGGGGLAATPAALSGGNGGAQIAQSTAQAAGGTSTAANGTAGAATPTSSTLPGAGGGGGASQTTAAGGTGGAGGFPGGGGGGGGASLNGQLSGAGGAGAAGLVIAVTYF